MTVLNVNILAIIVALIAHQALGFLWYGPLFGKMWMEAKGMKPSDAAGMATPALIISSVAALVMSIAMAMLISAASVQNAIAGVTLALIVGIGIIGTTQVTNMVYEDRNRTVVGLYIAYELVALIVMAIILGVWR